jgi:hypothetical protein
MDMLADILMPARGTRCGGRGGNLEFREPRPTDLEPLSLYDHPLYYVLYILPDQLLNPEQGIVGPALGVEDEHDLIG